MGRYNFNPARVHQRASQFLELQRAGQASGMAGAKKQPWFTTIGQIPPSEILTRPLPVQHSETSHKTHRRAKKPSKMFIPLRIVYEEDKLRTNFYSDHPWELARPRVILEQDGKDGQKCDWSKIQQPGRELNGERCAH